MELWSPLCLRKQSASQLVLEGLGSWWEAGGAEQKTGKAAQSPSELLAVTPGENKKSLLLQDVL